jgi:hypothetical protein
MGALSSSRVSRFNSIGGLCNPIPALCANTDHAMATAMTAKNRLWIRSSEKTKNEAIPNVSLSIKTQLCEECARIVAAIGAHSH